MDEGPENADKTEVAMAIDAQLMNEGNALIIEPDDTAISGLSEASTTATSVNHFFCKYNYFHNRKIYFGFSDAGNFTLL